MTRFKELARIEAAIEHRDEPALRWALAYCKLRISNCDRKQGVQHWKRIEKKVMEALEIRG